MTLTESIEILREDSGFVRGFKRGIGLILLTWLIVYVGGCFAYPLIAILQ